MKDMEKKYNVIQITLQWHQSLLGFHNEIDLLSIESIADPWVSWRFAPNIRNIRQAVIWLMKNENQG
jgi:hypothetical protein